MKPKKQGQRKEQGIIIEIRRGGPAKSLCIVAESYLSLEAISELLKNPGGASLSLGSMSVR